MLKYYGKQVRFALYMEEDKANLIKQLSRNNRYESVNKFINELLDVALNNPDQDKYSIRIHFHRDQEDTFYICTDKGCNADDFNKNEITTDMDEIRQLKENIKELQNSIELLQANVLDTTKDLEPKNVTPSFDYEELDKYEDTIHEEKVSVKNVPGISLLAGKVLSEEKSRELISAIAGYKSDSIQKP